MLAFKKSEDKDGWDLAIVNFQKARAPFLDVCIQIQDVALIWDTVYNRWKNCCNRQVQNNRSQPNRAVYLWGNFDSFLEKKKKHREREKEFSWSFNSSFQYACCCKFCLKIFLEKATNEKGKCYFLSLYFLLCNCF